MHRVLLISLALLAVPLTGCAGGSEDGGGAGERIQATVTTNVGEITILLYGDLTPQTVKNFGTLAQDGFYDQVKFHRVIQGFMLQGGDPTTADSEDPDQWGSGGPGYRIIDEFPCNNGQLSTDWTGYRSQEEPCDGRGGLALEHDRAGTLSMANVGEPRTGGSQFFITLGPTPNLDGTHAVFGQVVEGMDVVHEIGNTTTKCKQEGHNPGDRTCSQNRWNYPVDPIFIESITLDGPLPDVQLEKF